MGLTCRHVCVLGAVIGGATPPCPTQCSCRVGWQGRRSPVNGLAHHNVHVAHTSRIRQHHMDRAPRTLHICLHPAGNMLKIVRHLLDTSRPRYSPYGVTSRRVRWLCLGRVWQQHHIPLPCARRMGPMIRIWRELLWWRQPRCLCPVITLMSGLPFIPKVCTRWSITKFKTSSRRIFNHAL